MTTPAITREEWLSARRSGLGGSDVGGVLGDEGTCARKVAYEKLGATPDYDDEPRLLRLGRFLEQFVAWEYALATGRTLVEPEPWKLYRHPEVAIAFASPDRFIVAEADGTAFDPPRVLEIKTHGPELYRIVQLTGATDQNTRQLHWTMACTGAEAGAFTHLDRGWAELLHYDVQPHAALISQMLEAAQKWWRDYVVAEKLPEPLPSLEYCGDCPFRRTCKGVTSRAVAPTKTPGKPTLPFLDDPELHVAVGDYLQAGAEKDGAERRREEARGRIVKALGDREGARGDGFKVHAKEQVSWRYDTEALNALPPLLALDSGTIVQALVALSDAGIDARSLFLREEYRLESRSRPVRVYVTNNNG